MTARQIVNKFLSVEQAEGVGARVRRSVGRPEVCEKGGEKLLTFLVMLGLK